MAEQTATKQHRQRYDVSPEKFVETWQSSNSLQEVADKLGMPKHIVQSRASLYRRIRKDGSPGVNLKKMKPNHVKTLNVEKLNGIIENGTATE